MNIPDRIKHHRKTLKENQTEYGKRFGVSHVAVSDWELGKSEAPYRVLEAVLNLDPKKRNSEIRAFFEALWNTEPEAYETLFYPVAYQHFRSVEAMVQNQVHQELYDQRWFQENKPEVQLAIRMAVGATVNTLKENYRHRKEVRDLEKGVR
jgi:transcriptional regulator with XRE-family HTH domain